MAEFDQAKPSEVFHLDPPVVCPAFPFGLHTPDPHADPAIQVPEKRANLSERSGEVIRHPAHHRVDFPNDLPVQVAVPLGKISDRGLKFLPGFGSHRHRAVRDVEA